MPHAPTPGARLRAARIAAGFTRLEAAREVRRTVSTIGNWERDHTEPSLEELALLTGIYGVSADYILTGNGRRPHRVPPPPPSGPVRAMRCAHGVPMRDRCVLCEELGHAESG